jgi:hypothetical protein
MWQYVAFLPGELGDIRHIILQELGDEISNFCQGRNAIVLTWPKT